MQSYTSDLSSSLLARNHTPIVFCQRLGRTARGVRNATVPVVNDLDSIGSPPDIIHGQHHLPTMAALLRFTNTPAVYTCHDWYGRNSFAPRFPRILRYMGVDASCRDRLIFEDGIFRQSFGPGGVG